jgi:hypothetical protein
MEVFKRYNTMTEDELMKLVRVDGYLYGHLKRKGVNPVLNGGTNPLKFWRAQEDSNLRPTDS